MLIINTGDGKGKTTAALGTVFRAMGRGFKCGVIQFLKGKWETGERKFAKTLPDLSFHVMGLGFTWESDNLDQDRKAAGAAWTRAIEMMNDGLHKVVVLDEMTYAINFGWLNLIEVVRELDQKPKDVHVILTGRNCPEQLMEMADTVSVIQALKHPYAKGIPAVPGIDY